MRDEIIIQNCHAILSDNGVPTVIPNTKVTEREDLDTRLRYFVNKRAYAIFQDHKLLVIVRVKDFMLYQEVIEQYAEKYGFAKENLTASTIDIVEM